MSTDSLSAPGGATYSSQTMHVGDGTWDASKDTFLLPNIQGLNYQTLVYNAAITFLGVVPAAILIAKFYHGDPYLALRLHISLQIFTVILATVALVLGYFAVGPSRSLTNPHHGIGIALYVLVVVQFLGGALVHRLEKGKARSYLPIKLMLHQWLGRAIALLAVAQISIGLALYGSPIWLFVLYALAVFGYLVVYFVLTYLDQRRQGLYYEGTESSYTDTNGSRLPPRSGISSWTGPAVMGAGVAGLRSRLSQRNNQGQGAQQNRPSRHNQSQSQYTDGDESYLTEKYGDNTWRDRFLGAIGGIGAYKSARKFFRRRDDDRTELSYNSRYDEEQDRRRRHYNAPPTTQSAIAMARAEEGLPPAEQVTEDHWQRVENMEAAQAAAVRRQNQQHRPVYPQGMASEVSERPYRNGQAHVAYGQNSSQGSEGEPASGFLGKLAAAMGIGSVLQRRKSRKQERQNEARRQRQNEINRLDGANEHQPLVRPSNFGPDGRVPNVVESPLRHQAGHETAQSPQAYPSQNDYSHTTHPAMPEQQNSAAPPSPPTHHDFAYGPASRPTVQPQAIPLPPPQVIPPTSQRPSPAVNTTTSTISGGPAPMPLPAQNVPISSQAQHPPRPSVSTTISLNTDDPFPILQLRHSANHLHIRRLSPQEVAASRRVSDQLNQAQGSLPAHVESGPQVPAHTSPPPPRILSGTITSSPTTYTATGSGTYEENRQRRRAERARAQQGRQARMLGNDGRIDYT